MQRGDLVVAKACIAQVFVGQFLEVCDAGSSSFLQSLQGCFDITDAQLLQELLEPLLEPNPNFRNDPNSIENIFIL